MALEGWVSSNFNTFTPGDIITHNQILDNHDLWFGYPIKMAKVFLTASTVEDSNIYLEQFQIPWRISKVEVVNGMRQWTIA